MFWYQFNRAGQYLHRFTLLLINTYLQINEGASFQAHMFNVSSWLEAKYTSYSSTNLKQRAPVHLRWTARVRQRLWVIPISAYSIYCINFHRRLWDQIAKIAALAHSKPIIFKGGQVKPRGLGSPLSSQKWTQWLYQLSTIMQPLQLTWVLMGNLWDQFERMWDFLIHF